MSGGPSTPNVLPGPGFNAGASSAPPPPPGDDKIEALTRRLTMVESKVERLDDRLRNVEVKLGEIGGKLDVIASKMPSWWQAPLGTGGLLALLVALIAIGHRLGL